MVSFIRKKEGEVLFMFYKHVGAKESNESEMLIILEVLRIESHAFFDRLIVENDSSDAFSWINASD